MFINPTNTPSRAVAGGGLAVVLDIFSSIREDYGELTNKYIPARKGNG